MVPPAVSRALPPAVPPSAGQRTRRDRCPALFRPWRAEDGLLVRLRLVGGHVPVAALRALLDVATTWGDGAVHLTGRANLQLRALPGGSSGGSPEVAPEVVEAVLATGLVPSRTHELVRNLLVSPQTGLAGGRADLRPVATALDAALRADAHLAALPGRFLFVLDDGRGDLADRGSDLGLVALDDARAQLRVGEDLGPVVALAQAPRHLVELAHRFLDVRGDGPGAAWHVRELGRPLVEPCAPEPGALVRSGPLPHDRVPGGVHVAVPGARLDQEVLDRVLGLLPEPGPNRSGPGEQQVVVTPWHGVLVPAAVAGAGEERR